MGLVRWIAAAAAALALSGLACSGDASARRPVILATTTSVVDTGLIDSLAPAFQAETGYAVKPVAVGSGEAIAMARRGDADVVLAHSPDAERDLVVDGFASHRWALMRNRFEIVGPKADPAGVQRATTAAEAFRALAAASGPFVTRGDGSGTHVRERALWKAAGLDPAAFGAWYIRSSAGQAETLRIADDRSAYALTDASTYLAQAGRLKLARLFAAKDPALENRYSVLVLDAAKLPGINAAGGRALADFLVSARARAIIAAFGEDRFGRPLFEPDDDS